MMRYTGASWKRSRRLGFSTLETGKELAKRPYGPGQHGNDRKKKPSEYGKQLIEKQKLRHMYDVNERQFRRLFMIALRSNEITGYAFMKLLESRLDNLVFRIGFARTRAGARQLVNHGHIEVNGKKVDIPSYLCSVGDVIALRENSRDLKVVKESLDSIATKVGWIEVDAVKLEGKYIREVDRKELPQDIVESQIVEYYNRKL
ncbi:MAG: 30S ribosomal protein S4 [Erysipelotrichaceae bacterium]|nr:30S ribosomal protein S4 [Bacilli bacterium]NLV28813.1 30S ribosomal protein S4 [Erysipelotrichaceae bacterium]HPY79592.1 30S ribosomal protein S4 [Bacilli bacterium]HQA55933.1 30S ribosomal protein S4 [Bacilli bacterium]